MHTQSNLSLITVGIMEVREGHDVVQGGIAHIAEGIVKSWDTPIAWSYGRDDAEVNGVTTVGQMYLPRRHPDGKEDAKFLPAVYLSLAENFAVDGGFTSADKQAFKRAHNIAAALVAGAPIEFEDVDRTFKGRKLKVRAVTVPASVAFTLTKEDGSPTADAAEMVEKAKSNFRLFNKGKKMPEDAAFLDNIAAERVECVGGRHPVFGKVPSASDISNKLAPVAVEAGLIPAPKARNGSTTDKGVEFGKSLDFVIRCIEEAVDPDGDESGMAPCNAVDEKLHMLAQLLDHYFEDTGQAE